MTKLFNFLDQASLNNARQLCQAELISSSFLLKPYGIEPQQAEELLHEGKNIFRHLVEVKNNLLYYQNILITVNLPRIKADSSRVKKELPRLHIAYCKTMQDLMHDNHNTFFISRALNSQRTIYIEAMHNNLYSLSICKYCLNLLRWQNYNHGINNQEKNKIVNQFNLKQFYQRYDHPQVHPIFLAMSKEKIPPH